MEDKLDPKAVEGMKTFRMEADNANEIFRKLERNMGNFTRKMNMANVRTVDFADSWKAVGKVDALASANKSLDAFQKKVAEVQKIDVSTDDRAKPTAPTTEGTTNRVDIGTIRIDVSGVTDKTDKQKLAEDISARVSKSLQSKMGGPLSTGGYNRGM